MSTRPVRSICTMAMAALVLVSPEADAQVTRDSRAPATSVVEIRSYNLKPGSRDRFHQTFLTRALPMLQRWNVDVVGYGPSLHDSNSYFLMRSFPGIDERQRREDAFYGSEEWIKGPRAAILADIESYTTIVIHVDDETLRALRRATAAAKENTMSTVTSAPSDLAILLELNKDYVDSVQTSNVARFKEILADDFLCSLPDGSLIDRERFLTQTAVPVTISNLSAHDVQVRLMGDVAIVHARTSYKTSDGKSASGRYTDVWARRNGRWLAVSAHVTRLP
jgi:ketosteroid isomerase-like protein